MRGQDAGTLPLRMGRTWTAVLCVSLGACTATRSSDLDACRSSEMQLALDAAKARWVIETCDRAYRRTGSDDALLVRVRAQLIAGDLDAVIAAADHAKGSAAPRLWHLAGDAELNRQHPAEARRWYERSLAVQRTRDAKRAGNSAARIADIAAAANEFDGAIRFQYQAVALAEIADDQEARNVMGLGLANLLLDVGDARTARAALANLGSSVATDSVFYRDYLLAMGEVETIAGRTSAAAASFDRCVEAPPVNANPRTQLRCHVGRAALIAQGARPGSDEEALRAIDDATRYVGATDRMFGADSNRIVELRWMRALVDLRAGRPDAARTILAGIATSELGAPMNARVHHASARAMMAAGRSEEAEALFRDAAAAFEGLRDRAQQRETLRSFPRELRAPYEAIFAIRAGAGDPLGAIAVMERALQRDFFDQLAAGVVGDERTHRETSSATLARRVGEAERRVRAQRALESRPHDSFDPTLIRGAVLGFFAAEGSLWRVWITDGRLQLSRIATLEVLAPLVAAVREDPDEPAGGRLREFLLPGSILPPAGTLLTIVPDPFLEGVRFASLRGRDAYLIERHPILIAPTFATTINVTQDEPSQPAVVLGDPDATLPSARAEATAVAALLHVDAQVGQAANQHAIARARRASVLHVASHGSIRDDGTSISLAGFELGAAEVIDLGLAPDLAVVASCASAATRPDGMWTSVTAALLASGAGVVVGALGSIPDDAAAEIVVDFYRRAPNDGPAVALADAQRAAIARGTPARTWSAFAAFGHEPARQK